ncbi:MAG: hypothetical protein AMXMBFR58_02440 [Phycisphaerae bacterium]|nr:polysaccharide biosynthesis/export family protein [Phycisphaerales bacterium]
MLASRAGLVAAAAAAGSLLGGCSMDSFIDPSITGRWEATPTSLPILDRISVIEDDNGDDIELTEVTPEDLIAEAREYRISPGDRLLITLYDFEDRQGGTELPRDVDLQGNIDLPQLGLVNVAGRTVLGAQDEIGRVMSRIVRDPLIAIVPVAQRQQTFTMIGAVETPGPYFIPRPDYRLLEAVTASGRFPETIEEIYVIRQIALDESVRAGIKPQTPDTGETQTTRPTTPDTTKPADSLIDLIDELSGGKDQPQPAGDQPKDPAPAPAPEPVPDSPPDSPSEPPAPAEDLPEPKTSAPGVLAAAINLDGSQPGDATPPPAPGARSDEPPPIDLVQPGESQQPAVDLSRTDDEPTWVFVNGEWVMVKTGPSAQPGAGQDRSGSGPSATGETGPSALVTQRVIRIPVKQLLAGDARYNIVVRQGDTIRVPSPIAGLVYMTGQVQRPGPYTLPDVGKLTLLRAVDSAGGLSAIAIPERCDITRIVGRDRQATIRLNLRSISEQTEPDIYLKPDDRINVGTNFWALPLAVLRGGFRTNYGFGFVVDRNFGNDIFGPPPEDRSF